MFIIWIYLFSINSFAEYSVLTENAGNLFEEGDLQEELLFETKNFQNGLQFWIMAADYAVNKFIIDVDWKSNSIYWFSYKVSIVNKKMTCFQLIDFSQPIGGQTMFSKAEQYRVKEYHCRVI